MKESENRNNSQVKFIASIVMLSICISVVTSSIIIKTLVPVSEAPTSTPFSTIQPTFTLTLTQTSITQTPTQSPSYSKALTPMQIQMPRIESNLLNNSGFEDGLSGWTVSDNVAGINVFETTGVNGKAFCSRRYTGNQDFLEKEFVAFAQEVSIDPTQAYFFSGWVKLNKAVHVYAMAQLYNWSENVGWALATQHIGTMPDGETTNGWVFIHGEISMIYPSTNHFLFGLWHGLIHNAPNIVDSTICVDDLVLGKIIK
jgi:hypothetical protein